MQGEDVFVFIQRGCPGQQHVAGVEADIHQHRGYAGFSFAIDEAPVERCGATVAGKQRGMDVDAAVGRHLQQRFGEYLAKGDDNDNIRFECADDVDKARIAHLERLVYRDAVCCGHLLYRRRHQLLSSPLGTVRLGNDRHKILPPLDQFLQGRAGKVWCPHKNGAPAGHRFSSAALRALRWNSSRLSAERWSTNRMPSRWSISCWKAIARRSSAFQVRSTPSRSSALTITRAEHMRK